MSTQPAPITLWYFDTFGPYGRRHWFADKPAALAARQVLASAAANTSSPIPDHHLIIMPADIIPTVAGLLEFATAYAYVVEEPLRRCPDCGSDFDVEC